MFKRVFVFFLVNILVVLTIGLVLQLTGLNQYFYQHGLGNEQLLIFSFIWGMGGAFISLLLSRFMAKMMMGVRVIDPNSAHGQSRELLEVVHRLARKAGIDTMPEVGIYASPEVNAFATGPTKNKALVAVSSGLLERMDQREVEGVLGHEVAHVANGDMVTMTLVQGIVNAFVLFLSHIIARLIDSALRDREGRGGLSGFSYYLVYNVISVFLSFLAFPIVAWVSRYREYRADAGGASLAGRDKMIAALRALKDTQRFVDPTHKEMDTLKISGKPSRFMQMMATHPPLDDRIRRLEVGA